MQRDETVHKMWQRLFLMIIVSTILGCHAQAPISPVPERMTLENASHFTMLSSPASLPREVFRYCADLNGLLAAPDQRWNATDVMTPGLSMRRLVWAAYSDNLFVVHFEQGGFAHSHHIVVVRRQTKPNGAELLWLAEGPRLKDYSDFVRSLKSDAFHPESFSSR